MHKKTILVHLGPHKTGSTAIQKSLADASALLKDAGVAYANSEGTHAAALDLVNERFGSATEKLEDLSQSISFLEQKSVILSHEDFCGELIGRSLRRKVYPKLTKHLRLIRRAFGQHEVKFVFFLREESDWLRSCYHQHLKYRTRYSDFATFADRYGQNLSWTEVLAKPLEVFGDRLSLLDYTRDPKAGITELLGLLGLNETGCDPIPAHRDANRSPDEKQIKQLERINQMTDFPPSAWFAKSLVLNEKTPLARNSDAIALVDWPPKRTSYLNCALPELHERSNARVQKQKVDDILPPIDVDLDTLANQTLPKDAELPDLTRADIHHQSLILNYHLRGKSKLNHLNGLTISYLRRDTDHTQKAQTLFHRIWREQGTILVNELSTRWLISTLQTFLDHGENEAQRQIGTTGYFYANMMKIYEGERAIEGLEQIGKYAQTKPQTKNQFRGLDRYEVGGSDLMLNTNALALEIALRDDVAGIVLQEFLLRVKSAETVFSRHDRTRFSNGINKRGFEDVWAFFDPWDD